MTRLQRLEAELLTLSSKINLKPTLEAAWDAGRILSEARHLIAHGQWRQWINRVGLSKSSAQEYMAVFASIEKENVRRCGQIGIRQFIRTIRAARRASINQDRVDALAALPSVKGSDDGLVHADALDWLRKRPSASIPFIVTDPPFGLGLRYDDWNEPKTAESYIKWFAPYFAEMQRVLVPGGMLVVCQSSAYLRHFWDWYGSDIVISALVVAVKKQRLWRPVVRWIKPGAEKLVMVYGGDALIGEYSEPSLDDFRAAHPCPMTVKSSRYLVERYTLPDALVLDPFMGLGSFGLACRELSRRYIGIERSAKYLRLARQRMSLAASPA